MEPFTESFFRGYPPIYRYSVYSQHHAAIRRKNVASLLAEFRSQRATWYAIYKRDGAKSYDAQNHRPTIARTMWMSEVRWLQNAPIGAKHCLRSPSDQARLNARFAT